MVLAKDAAVSSENAKAVAWVTSVCGFAHYLVGDYKRACELLARGVDVLESHGGRGFEASRPKLFLVNALWAMGRLKEARAQLPALIAEADERGELSGYVNLRIGPSSLAWLMADDSAGARENVRLAMARWPRTGSHTEHFYELWALTNIALYAGDSTAVAELASERLPAYSRSFLQRVQGIRWRTWQLRARCALAMARAREEAREPHLRIASKMARSIAREDLPWTGAIASFLRAGVARLRGDNEAAIALLRPAIKGFDKASLALDAAVARYCLGLAIGGEEGELLMKGATLWLEEQTVKKPLRFLAMLAPGFCA
jgi:hypothetical protein